MWVHDLKFGVQMKKIRFSTELAYVMGLLILTLGNAMMERADFGVSMVVAPAYLLHLKISPTYSFFSFGMAEYTLQAFMLILMVILLRRFKPYYLFSFVTAVFYGVVLDLWMKLTNCIPNDTFIVRAVLYVGGILVCSAGISFFFHSYIAPEVYELLVKELSAKFKWNINKVKTTYDISSCLISIVMSFLFFGFGVFRGVKLGTVLCALVNGAVVGLFSRIYDKVFDFQDVFPKFKKIFE